jgi:HPt (histidine-containing phosphotransfer) domain-containing protein
MTTIDRPVFEALKETAGADFVVELVDAFFEEAPGMLEAMRGSLAAGDAEKFRRAAHSLKSNANTFGATGLGAIAKDLELSGLANVAARPEPLAAVNEEYARVAAALKEMCR